MQYLNGAFFLCYILLLTSCSGTDEKKTQAFLMDAKHFCEIHDLTYWEKSGKLEELNKLDSSERQTTLVRAIHGSISTPEMKNVVFLADDDHRPLNEYYPYLQKEIPKLIGEPFDCPAVEAFYTPINNPRVIDD